MESKDGHTQVKVNAAPIESEGKTPVKFVQVLKGHQTWLERKLLKLRKELANDFYNAVKESFIGTQGLTNKWIIWDQKPIGGFEKFQLTGNRRKKRIRNFLLLVWKNYKISNDRIHLMDEFERLRVMDFQLNKTVQMGEYGQLQQSFLKTFW